MPDLARPQMPSGLPLRTHHLLRGAAIAIGALAIAPAAFAHVTTSPSFVEVGVSAIVAFETPNERAPHATTSLVLEAPPGIQLESVAPPDGWSAEVSDRTARWTGGRIERDDVVAFALRVTARTRPGTEKFSAVQAYDDGKTVEWTTTLTVLPAAAEQAPSQRLGRALAAGAVGLAVIAGSLLVLRRLPRRKGV
jgi:uncharacterized protein YcnI